jgi:phosphatidylglycerophosphate synthase
VTAQDEAGPGRSTLHRIWAEAPAPLRLVALVLALDVVIGFAVVLASNLDEGRSAGAAALGSAFVALWLLMLHGALALLLLRGSRVVWVLVLLYGLLGLTRSPEPGWLHALSVAVSLAKVAPLLLPSAWRWVWRRERA